MIEHPTSRGIFISSIAAFLVSYGLDGIDIDFEYPGAIERNAPATDTPNLTAFFSEMKGELPAGTIISIATPAGYWFLKGFEINKIAKSVTYMNMMSYDYHGQWDTNVTGQAPVTNPHTSILDMKDSVLLYTRAGIDLSTGPCTLASGYMVDFEVFDIIINQDISPVLDNTSQTYWLDDINGDLLTFDLSDTWQLIDFAGQSCFGGTFIW
ncbi:glycoside hydrolase family 18 protein [Sphaerobolus stellatus SS14]|uniref:Glycoside hydrolase family 18 protein n=1 Tax=Sphaerobolus stellatus (strain SS14) TaxID=990650 RepID=A0A0C9VNJ0_SPHS4|nr:glycoside hydrolase family 18 protein [Sphaerobolus stellatus SS14]